MSILTSSHADKCDTVTVVDDTVMYELPLAADHFAYLTGSAISPAVLRDAGVFTVDPKKNPQQLPAEFNWLPPSEQRGIVFPWKTPTGDVYYQLRPDNPPVDSKTGRVKKYLFGKGKGAPLGMITFTENANRPLVLVEGTKQALAFASWCPHVDVVALAGCWSWSRNGNPTEMLSITCDREIYICLDADAARNIYVYTAGVQLAQHCMIEGAREVKFITTGAGGTIGIDDFLANRTPEQRHLCLTNLIKEAKTKPAKTKPTGKQVDPTVMTGEDIEASIRSAKYKTATGINPQALAEDIYHNHHFGLASDEDTLLLYNSDSGCFEPAKFGLIEIVLAYLGPDYSRNIVSTMRDIISAKCARDKNIIGEYPTQRIAPFKNGVFDLDNWIFSAHDPKYKLRYTFAATYDKTATAPLFEKVATRTLGLEQLPSFLQVASTALDISTRSRYVALLAGGENTGKSTLLEILVEVIGEKLTAGANLSNINESKFSVAELNGKALNVSAELSTSKELKDLSILKRLTGGDRIQVEKKWGSVHDFYNHSLLVFSTNKIPIINDTLGPYLRRVRPFVCSNKIDNSIVDAHIVEKIAATELPGIVNILLAAFKTQNDAHGIIPIADSVMRYFTEESDRVHQFFTHACQIVDKPTNECPTRSEVHKTYVKWCEKCGYEKLSYDTFITRFIACENVKVVQRPDPKKRTRVLNILIRDETEWDNTSEAAGYRSNVKNMSAPTLIVDAEAKIDSAETSAAENSQTDNQPLLTPQELHQHADTTITTVNTVDITHYKLIEPLNPRTPNPPPQLFPPGTRYSTSITSTPPLWHSPQVINFLTTHSAPITEEQLPDFFDAEINPAHPNHNRIMACNHFTLEEFTSALHPDQRKIAQKILDTLIILGPDTGWIIRERTSIHPGAPKSVMEPKSYAAFTITTVTTAPTVNSTTNLTTGESRSCP